MIEQNQIDEMYEIFVDMYDKSDDAKAIIRALENKSKL